MKIKLIAIYAAFTPVFILAGCSGDNGGYPSSEGKPYPYILKTGCEFAIVEELRKNSITSPVVEGAPDSWATGSISMGDHSISVSNCAVVENATGLTIYED